MLKHRQHIFFYIFSRATLNETFMAKYDGVLPRTPSVRPKSEIYTPRRDDDLPHSFHMPSSPPPPYPRAVQDKARQVNVLFGVLYSPMYIDFIQVI